MVWTLRISFLLFWAWLIFLASPYVALHDLAKAVDAKDLTRISERVNFHALRVSLSRQILTEHLKPQDLRGLDRQLSAEAGAAALDPIIEELVTPQALADLLEDAKFRRITGESDGAGSPMRLDLGSLEGAWRTYVSSVSQGFRSITIPVPADLPKEKQFRLTLRLSGMTWRLTGVELPQSLRGKLIERASQAMSHRSGQVLPPL